MAKVQLISGKIFIEGDPVDDSHIEKILLKAIPNLQIRFVYEDDEFAICKMNNKSASIANMIFLKEGEFKSISEWEKGVHRTIKYLKAKLAPDVMGITEIKDTELL